MIDKTLFTATEARQHFFELLRQAEEKGEVTIIKKDAKRRFKLIFVKEKKKRENVDKILKEIAAIGLKTKPWEEMKKIIETRYENRL
ncbi:type II toxin-antitoxin system prevent-host-death family antitoxin [Candidatus Roizmanbacteria bacterium]|nr:type II toxin-antitoxin system prevent-host-death family antitoxin [Candidatus Roizmanbacteria bacterium]